jgi:hypothetical protein
MTFLPEADQEFFQEKNITYELLTESINGTEHRGVLFPVFRFEGNLRTAHDGNLLPCDSCRVLVLVPNGYSTARLDSFYTAPWLKRPDGNDPHAANSEQTLFQQSWQFWSRHLDEGDWRVGVDGFCTFINYIRGELRAG